MFNNTKEKLYILELEKKNSRLTDERNALTDDNSRLTDERNAYINALGKKVNFTNFSINNHMSFAEGLIDVAYTYDNNVRIIQKITPEILSNLFDNNIADSYIEEIKNNTVKELTKQTKPTEQPTRFEILDL